MYYLMKIAQRYLLLPAAHDGILCLLIIEGLHVHVMVYKWTLIFQL